MKNRKYGIKTTKLKLKTIELAQIALKMRTEGKTFEEIGEAIGRGRSAAYQIVQRYLGKALYDAIEPARNLELDRLDKALSAIWDKVETGDLSAIDRFLKISERRAKMCGLDMPVKTETEITGPVSVSLNMVMHGEKN